jgi:hypothetical protein
MNINQPDRDRFLGIFRVTALIALVIGAIGSLGFMFRASQHTPRILLILFIVWVLSPFAALLWANMVSRRWSVLTQGTLYCVVFIVALGSLAVYSKLIDIKPAGSANAFLWVIVPPLSLLFIAIVIPIAAFISSRSSRRGDGN